MISYLHYLYEIVTDKIQTPILVQIMGSDHIVKVELGYFLRPIGVTIGNHPAKVSGFTMLFVDPAQNENVGPGQSWGNQTVSCGPQPNTLVGRQIPAPRHHNLHVWVWAKLYCLPLKVNSLPRALWFCQLCVDR